MTSRNKKIILKEILASEIQVVSDEYVITEPTARSAVPDITPGRGPPIHQFHKVQILHGRRELV